MTLSDPDKIIWRKVDGRTLVSHINSETCYALEGSAELVWDDLVAGKNFEEIVRNLVQVYKTDTQTVAEDVRRLLDDLGKEGLINP